ncbi:unnamed protein product, partial [Ixodes pacificus]
MESQRNTARTTAAHNDAHVDIWKAVVGRAVASLRTGEAAYRGFPRMLRPTGWTAICRALSQRPAESPCPHQGPRRRTRNPCAMATLATAQYRAPAVPRRSPPELDFAKRTTAARQKPRTLRSVPRMLRRRPGQRGQFAHFRNPRICRGATRNCAGSCSDCARKCNTCLTCSESTCASRREPAAP